MYKGTASRKMKSVSVEDLGTIVKQMINGALEDTEQMAKLHRAIYEELYFEKITEFEDESLEHTLTKSSAQRIFKKKSTDDIINCDEFKKCAKEGSKSNCTEGSEICLLNGQGDNHKVQITANKSTEISKNSSAEGNQIERLKLKERRISSKNKLNERSLEDNVLGKERAFDIWRREKTKAMRRMLKEERRKRQEELAAKQEEIERKRANHEAYLRSRKLLEKQRKLEETQRRATREDLSRVQAEENARITANEEAFKTWMKRKNSESAHRYQPRKSRPQTGKTRYSSEVDFDSWLDQLDSVLHQKYLRERRYRVRSFYCQPAYYGTAALCMQ